jgi:two-component system chemotaxis response regulator CheY
VLAGSTDSEVVKRVLVIDDSEAVRQLVRQALVPAGYEVVEAGDGVQGLAMIGADRQLSLVLCDVSMPHMTGLEMLIQLQAQGIVIPVIMLTAQGQPSLVRRAREAGAHGWMVKPFKVDLLLTAVGKVLSP